MLKKLLFDFLRNFYYVTRFTFARRSKMVYVFGCPGHTNMGDHAMVLSIKKFFNENFPQYGLVFLTVHHYNKLVKFLLKSFLKKNDIVATSGGNHIGDRYNELEIYKDILTVLPPPRKLLLFPQTIFFNSQDKLLETAAIFNKNKNVVLFCRDRMSYQIAQEYFKDCALYLFPDIVTLFVGVKKYNSKRTGILFCLRNDEEAYYSSQQLQSLKEKFTDIPINQTDTFLHNVSGKYVCKHREKVLNDIWEEYSKYKVIITDRFHGVIFSLISATPVVVLSSIDHKLKSGVEWFLLPPFDDYVMFANSIDEAYIKAKDILNSRIDNTLPPYFKDKYMNQLVNILRKELQV